MGRPKSVGCSAAGGRGLFGRHFSPLPPLLQRSIERRTLAVGMPAHAKRTDMRNRNAPFLPDLLRRARISQLPTPAARPFARLGLVALLVALLLPLAPAPAAQAAQTLALPFAGGLAV